MGNWFKTKAKTIKVIRVAALEYHTEALDDSRSTVERDACLFLAGVYYAAAKMLDLDGDYSVVSTFVEGVPAIYYNETAHIILSDIAKIMEPAARTRMSCNTSV